MGFSGYIPDRAQGSVATVPDHIVVFGSKAAVNIRLNNAGASVRNIRMEVHSSIGKKIPNSAGQKTFRVPAKSSSNVLVFFGVTTKQAQVFNVCTQDQIGSEVSVDEFCHPIRVTRLN